MLIGFLLTVLASIAPSTRPSAVIQFLEDRIANDPDDMVALNRLSNEYLTRFRETGDDADLDRALKSAEQSLRAVPSTVNKGGVAGRARALFSLHRFAAARDDAKQLLQLEPGKRYPLEILGDALLEFGDLAEAADVFAKMASFPDADPDATTESRLARLALAKGDRDGVRSHFTKSVELARLDDAHPAVLAWALVQAGAFEFSSGRWEAAEARYLEALKLKPDDWPAMDHLAELRAAQGKFDESVAMYRKLVERIPRPELFQGLGDVYSQMKSLNDARTWHDRAAAAYRAATEHGAVHYLHHLAGFYSDAEPNAAEAVRFAREDLKLRHSGPAYDALAWALYQSGDMPAAAEAMDTCLKTGLADSHVLYHASLIYARAGRSDDARSALRRAGETNPKFMTFHVHR